MSPRPVPVGTAKKRGCGGMTLTQKKALTDGAR